MAIKNTNLGGTDWVDGDILFAADQNDTINAALFQHINSDQTPGSIASSTTETEIGEIQVPANKIGTGVLVVATGNFATSTQSHNTTIKLYGGTSATGTSNTEFKSISRVHASASGSIKTGWTIVYWIDSLTWSSLNYINITGKNSASDGGTITTCESLVVFGK